jgi:3-oxoacyl-[acyl-carrier-protein] synthase-3
MSSAYFTGTGFHVPDRIVTNDDLTVMMDTSDEWIRTRTGIQQRHWVVEGETGVDLAVAASRQALDMAGLEPHDLEAIVFATSTPDQFAPGNGVLLQHALGAPDIPAIDIRTQCSGFVYSLSVADAWIRTGTYRRILVVGQEIQSTGMDLTTAGRDTAVIFADGAGAAILERDDTGQHGILAFDLHADGSHVDALWVESPSSKNHPRITPADVAAGRHLLRMDGKEVFRHAVEAMPASSLAVLAKAGLSVDQVKLVIPHQANLRISDMVQRRLGLRNDQIYNNIQRYGNTTAGTIPIALDECVRAGRIERGDIVLLTAFGSGFLWGSAVIRW